MKVSQMKLSIGKISNGLYGSDKDLNAPCTLQLHSTATRPHYI